ncbi:hypothetical protein PCCS19_21710 [Paenibacillus sp. CCS19]|nr:hypothetical protein PCCS19_21710 [Paenibacillus cellulosilyticus]
MHAVTNLSKSDYDLVLEDECVVGFKRYNKEFGMWVELRFSEIDSDAKEMLLITLVDEYAKQTLL